MAMLVKHACLIMQAQRGCDEIIDRLAMAMAIQANVR
jgi:hypothetical protein